MIPIKIHQDNADRKREKNRARRVDHRRWIIKVIMGMKTAKINIEKMCKELKMRMKTSIKVSDNQDEDDAQLKRASSGMM
jgi:translation initiation factor 1 (eIF-1/SUI1)